MLDVKRECYLCAMPLPPKFFLYDFEGRGTKKPGIFLALAHIKSESSALESSAIASPCKKESWIEEEEAEKYFHFRFGPNQVGPSKQRSENALFVSSASGVGVGDGIDVDVGGGWKIFFVLQFFSLGRLDGEPFLNQNVEF